MNSNQSSSTKKSVNRARKPNGSGNKPRPAPSKQGGSRRAGNGGLITRQVGASVAYASQQVGRAPQIRATQDKCTIVHRELIDSISGSSNFAVQRTFDLNPGMTESFPWLASIARSWEKYRFKKLRYCYYTRTGTSTPGSVMLIPDFDAADVQPVSEQVASSYVGVVEDAPWKDIVCVLPSSRLHENEAPKFVRTAPLGPNLDIKTYDCGKLFIGVVDGTSIAWGKLWVEYEIEFSIPCLPPSGIVAGAGGRVSSGGSGISDLNPIGLSPVPFAENEGFTVSGASGQTRILFQNPGTYLVHTLIIGTNVTAISWAPTFPISVVLTCAGFINNGALTNARQAFQITCTEPGSELGLTVTAATVTNCVILAASAPGDSLA